MPQLQPKTHGIVSTIEPNQVLHNVIFYKLDTAATQSDTATQEPEPWPMTRHSQLIFR